MMVKHRRMAIGRGGAGKVQTVRIFCDRPDRRFGIAEVRRAGMCWALIATATTGESMRVLLAALFARPGCLALHPRRAGPAARQGHLRHQLGGAGRARRLLPGAGRRHLPKHGLDVTILPGGPNVNHRLQLIAGRIEFYMSANTLQAFDAVAQNIPTLVVAAMFQKDPQVLLAHPDQGIEKFEDLKKLTLLDLQGGRRLLLPMDEARLRLPRAAGEALHLQPAAVPRRQAHRDAGLRHLGALRHRDAGRASSRRSSCSPTRAGAATRP